MKTFFDTSVLLPVFLEDHEHHEASLRAFLKAEKANSYCAAHSLAEVYAAATRLPGKHRASGEQVLLFLQDVADRLTVVALTAGEYLQALKGASEQDIAGGTVYDALLCHCALKAGSQLIYTWNVRHFQLLGPEIAKRVRTP